MKKHLLDDTQQNSFVTNLYHRLNEELNERELSESNPLVFGKNSEW